MSTSTVFVLLFAIANGAVPAVADCDHRAPREWSTQATGIESVHIVAKAGSLNVVGRTDATQIRVDGLACAERETQLAEIEIRTERSGSELRIEAIAPDGGTLFGGSAQLDLEIEVPRGVTVDIVDSSGELEVFGVAALEVVDSSGAIEIGDIEGDVRIEDSSGEIKVAGAGGDVWVRDSSGSIDIESVRGSVTIDRDSSGGIEIEDVERDVLVRSDSSGGIDVRGVGGDFTVEQDGSGGIHYEKIAGKVKIPKDK